jgi:hypothetical protein
MIQSNVIVIVTYKSLTFVTGYSEDFVTCKSSNFAFEIKVDHISPRKE